MILKRIKNNLRPLKTFASFRPGKIFNCVSDNILWDYVSLITSSEPPTNFSILASRLAATIDFWSEGVILPAICTIGILGKRWNYFEILTNPKGHQLF